MLLGPVARAIVGCCVAERKRTAHPPPVFGRATGASRTENITGTGVNPPIPLLNSEISHWQRVRNVALRRPLDIAAAVMALVAADGVPLATTLVGSRDWVEIGWNDAECRERRGDVDRLIREYISALIDPAIDGPDVLGCANTSASMWRLKKAQLAAVRFLRVVSAVRRPTARGTRNEMALNLAWATSPGARSGYSSTGCGTGCAIRALEAVPASSLQRFALRRELLIFLNGMLYGINPIVRSDAYADSYISFHFFAFVSIVGSGEPMARRVTEFPTVPVAPIRLSAPPLLQLARLHIQALLAFAAAKSIGVARKFYRLRVLRCLALQVRISSLRYF